jgi:D-alanyl-lipoteichoic acid acyltransferase DltB (MBOAT superfamily)
MTQALPLSHRDRVRSSHPLADYNMAHLIAYTLYSPLYIAGPIMTFNDFTWQVNKVHPTGCSQGINRLQVVSEQLRNPIPPTNRNLLSYAFRFLSCLLTMEVVLHFM